MINEEFKFEKVTCNEISDWYYNRMHTFKEEFCNLDQRLFERAREYVADKNDTFLKDLSLACYGVKYRVVFSAGRKLNRFTLMVSGDSIRGTMNRESPSNGIIDINCGNRVTAQHIHEYLTCCPIDCKLDRRLMEEAAKFVSFSDMDELSYISELRCYGNHVSCLFRSRHTNQPKVYAQVVGDSVIIDKANF